MNIAELAIKKRIVTFFFIFLTIFGGIIAYENLGRLEDPEYTIKDAIITTYYPGASANEVAEEVTEKIETAVQQLPELKRVTSISKTGISIVTATIKDQYDKNSLPQIWDELRRKITDIQSQLPPGAQTSIVNDDYGDVYGILLAITSDGYSYKEMEEYADFLRRELLLIPDVAKINLWGIQPQEVHIHISRQKLANLGISLNSIYQTLEKQNIILPTGNVKVDNQYIRINPTGKFTSVKQIGDLLIKNLGNNRLIYLKDVATIKRAIQTPATFLIRHNGENAYVLGASVIPGGDIIKLGDALKQKLNRLKPQTPLGMHIDVITFQPDLVKTAIDGFIISLVEALAIVFFVLFIFMGFRSSIIIGVTLLLTILATFIGMWFWQINLERISLGALIIALGMLVDNAIVINDGILVRLQKNEDSIAAAKAVVAQNAFPLLGATIIAILAFAAIGLSNDSTGEYTRSLFYVILMSLSISWLIAVTVTPLLGVMLLKVNHKKTSQNTNAAENYHHGFYNYYRRFLISCLKFRWLTLAILIICLGFSVYGFGKLENSFFPDSTRPQFMVHFWLPQGSDIRKTTSDVARLDSYIHSLKGVKGVTSFIGAGAPRFLLTYSPEKNYSSYAYILINIENYHIIDELMKKIQQFSRSNFLDAIIKQRRFVLGPSEEDTIEARFSGPNPAVLRHLADKAIAIMRSDGGIVGIKTDWREREKIIQPVLSDLQAKTTGITKLDLDKTLQMTFGGLNIGTYREYDKLLPILSKAPASEEYNVENLKDMLIWSPVAQKNIPLRQIISSFNISYEDTNIQKRDRKPTITAQGTQATGNSSVALGRIKKAIEEIQLPTGYHFEWGGEFESAHDAQKALFGNIPVMIIFVVLILITLFNAIRQPLIILLTVPLAVIGVTLGLAVTGQSFGFMALLGFLSLTGMLIKNSIVLIDQIDLEIKQNKKPFLAILDSSMSRLRPVMLAAITTVLGLIPLLFDIFFSGMAITIMAGLTFATILTLVIVPVLYAIFFKVES